jgi:hypothetical protein
MGLVGPSSGLFFPLSIIAWAQLGTLDLITERWKLSLPVASFAPQGAG